MFFKMLNVLLLMHIANSSSCTKYLHHLAALQMNLTYCFTTNSVPVTMCVNCYEHFKTALEFYDFMATNCSSKYFDKDRVNIVASTESALTGLWTKAFCDDCFNNRNINVFSEKNTTFSDCYHMWKNPCEECKAQYMDLNNFYNSLDEHNNGEVCYDIQDSMNRTRNMWSKEAKCCRRERNMTLFAVALSIISFLPIMFYSSIYLITKHRERNHDILSDEDPLYSSELPSSSRPYNINDINNPMNTNRPSTSTAVASNDFPNTSLQTAYKNGISSNEDLESSDDDILINVAVKSKKN